MKKLRFWLDTTLVVFRPRTGLFWVIKDPVMLVAYFNTIKRGRPLTEEERKARGFS